MLPLLLLLVTTQIPTAPSDSTLVAFCKQGRLVACQELAKTHPQRASEIQANLAKAAPRQEALKVAEEDAREKTKADESSGAEASEEPPNCKGQDHHIISRPIAEALEKHMILRGLYKPRDERFKIRAKDRDSHCGYQKWHRDVDAEVSKWLEDNPAATPEQFMMKLREIYRRSDMLKRFPNGF
jgi:hypothetical protein